jgi:phosphoglycolate phosphatase
MTPRFLERYRTHYLLRDPDLRLFAGVPALLTALAAQNVSLAVATGKSRVGLNRALAATGLGPMFDATCTADETFSKPHPAMLHTLMGALHVEPDRVLMVGDTSHDLQMAQNAQVHGLGVSYGSHAREALQACAPQAVVDSVPALQAWLLPRVFGTRAP